MIRGLALAGCLLAAPVLADCPAPGAVPAEVVFDSGEKVAVRLRGDVLSYVVTPVEGPVAATEALYGVLPLRQERDGSLTVYQWEGTPPDPARMAPGDRAEVKGIMAMNGAESPAQVGLARGGPDSVTVGGCALPVVILDARIGPADAPAVEVRRWYDPVNRITLRTEVLIYGDKGKEPRRQTSLAESIVWQ